MNSNGGFGYTFLANAHYSKNQKNLNLGLPITEVEINEEIRQSLLMSLVTSKGQRPLSPNYGCDLRKYLFMPNTPETQQMILSSVNNSLPQDEPRIKLSNVRVSHDENGSLLINIDYNIAGTEIANSLYFPLKVLE